VPEHREEIEIQKELQKMQQNLDIHLKRYKHPRLFKIFKAKEMQTINNTIFINNKLILATLNSENEEQ
jgi:hypothetical protein